MAKKKIAEKNVKKKEDSSGIFVPAGIFLGLGIGGIYSSYAIGLLLGLGAGFLGMAIVRSIRC